MFTLPIYVGIILINDSHVFLVKRHNTDWATGQWNFPGGLLEKGESLIDAAVREAYEEMGITIDQNDLNLIHVLQVFKNVTNTKDILGCYFAAHKWQGDPHNREPERHEYAEWFSITKMPHNTTAHAVQALDGFLSQQCYSENR